MERVLREHGRRTTYADQFKGFDWQTEEDAFMDGYHQHAKGGEFVTYERLRAMGTNGFQEPATGFENGRQRSSAPSALYTDGKFGSRGRHSADVHGKCNGAGMQAPGKQGGEGQVPISDQ